MNVPVSVRQRLWLQQDRASAEYRKVFVSGGTLHTQENGLDTRLIARPPPSAYLTQMDFFSCGGHLKLYLHAFPPKNIEDVRTVDARRVHESSMRRTAVCLQMDGGSFKHRL
jgi:hypothetical protein